MRAGESPEGTTGKRMGTQAAAGSLPVFSSSRFLAASSLCFLIAARRSVLDMHRMGGKGVGKLGGCGEAGFWKTEYVVN